MPIGLASIAPILRSKGDSTAVTLLAVAVAGRGLVDPGEPVLHAGDDAVFRGRAAFETTRVYGGRPFKLDEHLARLAGSAARLALPDVDLDACASLVGAAVARSGGRDAVLRIYVTDTTILAIVSQIPSELEEMRALGVSVVSLPLGVDARLRGVAPWLLGGVKSTSYAVNMAAQNEARVRGADDAVFVAPDGTVLEGTVTNVWWRRDRTLYTPALELGILAGVTRAALVEAAAGLGYEVREGAFPLEHLAGAEEAFLSSSVREVMPLVRLDGTPVGDARPGAASRELQTALRRAAST
jgi:4-amino-4-deoxychorismate lyase